MMEVGDLMTKMNDYIHARRHAYWFHDMLSPLPAGAASNPRG